MGHVVPIGARLADEMLNVCAEMRERITSGELHSLLSVVQFQGAATPQIVAAGRFKADPYLALMALERARVYLNRLIDERESELGFAASLG